MVQKTEKTEANTGKDRLLIQIGEQRKEWITNVATLANCANTEVFRVLVDLHMNEDPENFVIKLEKFRLKMKLEDLERREAAIRQEKEETIRSLEGRGLGKPEREEETVGNL